MHEVEDAVAELKAKGMSPPGRLTLVEGETYNALNASDAAAITSGTATLEAAIIGTPMAIVYKTSAINYKLLRPLISVDHFGLVNLIAEERIAKELIQSDFTADTLAAELELLLNHDENTKARSKLADAVEKLGHGGASKRAAEAINRVILDN
jgi:lipid-A-disaccharide synthase